MPAALVQEGEISASELAVYQTFLDDAASALAGTDPDAITKAGQNLNAFRAAHESEFAAAGHQDYNDQIDAALSQLSARYAAAPPLPGSLAARPDYERTPDSPGTAPTGGFWSNLSSDVGGTLDSAAERLSTGWASLIGKTGAAATAAATELSGTIKTVLVVLAVAIGLALLVFVWVYFGA